MSSANQKEVTVTLGRKPKLMTLDFDDFDHTMATIKRKFKLESHQFELYTVSGETGKQYCIDDEEDLQRFKNNKEFIVHILDSSPSTDLRVDCLSIAVTEPAHPPPYAESLVSVPNETAIVIRGEAHSLKVTPTPTSQVVVNEMIELVTNFDINSIIRQIDIVALCLRLVLFGVVNDRELEQEVCKLQAGVEHLCKRSTNAIKQFGMNSGIILSKTQQGIRYMLEGQGEIASEHFEVVKDKGKLMMDAAEELTETLENFDSTMKVVNAKIMSARSKLSQEVIKRQEAVEERVIEGKKKILEERKAEIKKDKATADMIVAGMATGYDHGRIKAVLDRRKCHWWCSGHHVNDRLVQAETALLDRQKADRKEAVAERDRLRKAEEKVCEEMLELVNAMKKTDATKHPEDLVENAVRGSERAMKLLRGAMENIVYFWKDIQLQAESLIGFSSGNIGQLTGSIDSKKEELFKTRVFQEGVIHFYAKWVAIKRMCETFVRLMQQTERDIQSSVSATPSRQQALKEIPNLLLTLDKKLAERVGGLREEGLRDEEEMVALMAVDHSVRVGQSGEQ